MASFSFTSGALVAASAAACSFATIGCGVPAGTTIAYQLSALIPAKPCSIAVGTFGSMIERPSPTTATARILPSSMKACSGARSIASDLVWPATTSVAAGAPPV